MNISQLFNQRVLRIPDHQKGFTWEEKQLSAFWMNLNEMTEIDGKPGKCYLGTIFLEETQPMAIEKWLWNYGIKVYNLMDGQQRLTTINILLFELLNISDNGYCGESKKELVKRLLTKSNTSGTRNAYNLTHSLIDKNYNVTLQYIFEENGITTEIDSQADYTKNLNYAKAFLGAKIKSLTNEQREIVFKNLTTSLLFDIKIIEDDLNTYRYFLKLEQS